MNNLIIKEIWNDDEVKEWEVVANNEFISAKQTVYIQQTQIKAICEKISYFLEMQNEVIIEIGKITGNYTPGLLIKMQKVNLKGDVILELKMEIADSEERNHFCSFYIPTDLGAVERLKEQMARGTKKIYLYDCQ